MCRLMKKNIDITELRKVMGVWTTGVAVVTTRDGDNNPVGMTINSLVSISLTPALIGWCIDRGAASFDTFARCRHFSVSVLNQEQAALAQRFATRGADKFAGIPERPEIRDDASSPLLVPDACAWLVCRLYRLVSLGDHLLLVGEVTDLEFTERAPLVFFRGVFRVSGNSDLAA